MPRLAAVVFAAVAALAGAVAPVGAAEVKVLTAGAMKAVVQALLPEFERQTGHKVALANDTAGGLARRIGEGEAFDLAIITPAIIADLSAKGLVAAGSGLDIAKVGIGVAVRQGAPAPDISTTAALKEALLAARSIAYIDPKAGGSSGIYFDKLIDRLGIGAEVRAKARLKQGGYVAEAVAAGEADLAVHQISEIVPVKGVVLVGPLPAEVQNTTVYTAGLAAKSAVPEAARALLTTLTGPQATAVLKDKGMQRP